VGAGLGAGVGTGVGAEVGAAVVDGAGVGEGEGDGLEESQIKVSGKTHSLNVTCTIDPSDKVVMNKAVLLVWGPI